jgi:hypothetical protein
MIFIRVHYIGHSDKIGGRDASPEAEQFLLPAGVARLQLMTGYDVVANN